MTFKQRLKGKIGSKVALVMVDGTCFRGMVRAVEEGVIIMDNVEQATATEIQWECNEKGECGYHRWAKVWLPKVYINPSHITRAWPWPSSEPKSDDNFDPDKEYVYMRDGLKVI
ncbi:MAG: hypothetical protein QCI38_03160 [Candidatus Thermoplasmatota archaeon]|nr:hypothetical protein [Candidatus Thermoplasmatota archaeon]